jgi:hypothetical protein
MNHAEKQRIWKLVGLCANAASFGASALALYLSIISPVFQSAFVLALTLSLINFFWGWRTLIQLSYQDRILRADEKMEAENKTRFKSLSD